MIRNEIKTPLTKEKAIKWLDNADIGIPVVICYNKDLRVTALYVGVNDKGQYEFYDDSGITGIFALTPSYIQNSDIMLDMLREDEELCIIADLIKKVKREEVK